MSILMSLFCIIPLFLGNLRGWEWLIILVVILLLFGGKKIPELMKGVGQGINSFKKGYNEARDEIMKDSDDESEKKEPKN